MEERGTFFFFLFFFFSRLKTHQNKQKEIQNFENTTTLSYALCLLLIKRAVVIKRDVFAFFFVFFSRRG